MLSLRTFSLFYLIFIQLNVFPDPGLKLNHTQANETARLIISTILNTENHFGTYGKELENFIDKSVKLVLDRSGNYSNFWSINKIYDYNELYNGIISEIIQFIKQKSIDYAQEDIINFHFPEKYNVKDLINTVCKTISQDLLKIVMQAGSLPEGALNRYIGVFLKNKVHKIILKEIKENVTLDLDYNCDVCQICPKCYGYFSNKSKRILLSCGHSICQNCLKQKVNDKEKPIIISKKIVLPLFN